MDLELEKNVVPTYLNYDLFPVPSLVLVLIQSQKIKVQTRTVAKLETPQPSVV